MYLPGSHHASTSRFDTRIERHEAKYVVPVSLLAPIRDYLAPYVTPDRHGVGPRPSYVVRTIQLDSADLVLHRASETEQLNRFKLRIRQYGEEPGGLTFLEIKRKTGRVIHKTRTMMAAEEYQRALHNQFRDGSPSREEGEEINRLNFLRLVDEIGARPICMIQYLRESYIGQAEDYARVTFDTNIRYQMTRSHAFDAVTRGGWRQMDTADGLRTTVPSFILELKSKPLVPFWMLELVQAFELERVGFCKYSTAVRLNGSGR